MRIHELNAGLAVALTLALPFVPACSCSDEPSAQDAVGAMCVPCDEFVAAYSGATESGAQLQFNAPMCNGGVCMTKHFRGRATCPFGNPAGGSRYDGADKECKVPGTGDLVSAPVPPQCAPRKDDVYCTCQCDGADATASYCTCPSGFSCKEATRSFDPTLIPPGAKFCVRDGDTVEDGYTCPTGFGCDEVADHCGYTSNHVPAPGPAGECGATQRVSTQLYKNQQVDKIDLLFMIDNSASMGDKQKILAATVPDLVERLTNPVCVDTVSREYVGSVASGASCSAAYPGSMREFTPIYDIHIGVITSSLGGHGADSCSDLPTQDYNPRQEDMAHLITRGKDEAGNTIGVETYQGLGFLNWDPDGASSPPGENNVDAVKATFAHLVRGADQDGCGFEASLEAWRRFLVDPAPYERMIPVPCFDGDTANQCRGPEGVDQVVLQQREDFLRPDSLVTVVMLTDENDCSVIDQKQYFLALQAFDGAGSFHVNRGTNACLTDPWDPSCKSCWEVSSADFPECAAGWANPELDDPLNLRCFEQTRRFGIDFLYPIRRYVDALTQPRLDDGTLNPLFCQSTTDGYPAECTHVLRDPSLVMLAGIVGVPWQDIAVDPTDLSKGYRPVDQLAWTTEEFGIWDTTPPVGLPPGKTLWNMILGEVDEDISSSHYASIVPTVDPLDPLMKESVDPRSGTHPPTGAELVPPGAYPLGNPVNASERNIPARNDLQYACTFELGQFGPVDCSLPQNVLGCDCAQAPENPLCWNGGSYGTAQHLAKAYPSRRQLAVLKGMGPQAVVASVCPANLHDPGAADFGYRPAVGAVVDRMKGALQGTCWNQELALAEDGTVPCVILEATKGDTDAEGNAMCPPCDDGTGVRSEATGFQKNTLETDAVFKDNGLNCVCQLEQCSPGEALSACQTEEVVTDVSGWCYVNPALNPAHNEAIVASCPAGNKSLIRFVGRDVPLPGSLTFLQCSGSSF